MAGEGSKQNATRDDAYAYLRTVKKKFRTIVKNITIFLRL
ncbi:unnamed protein product [Brassica oleracea]|uniref:Uncharacterized protein n=1 Tax=Brassica oleracea TaxID=3712 RepID=A0A3P6F7W4_BRAOL|nr:unnamed protein product [Brassica oleracea]